MNLFNSKKKKQLEPTKLRDFRESGARLIAFLNFPEKFKNEAENYEKMIFANEEEYDTDGPRTLLAAYKKQAEERAKRVG